MGECSQFLMTEANNSNSNKCSENPHFHQPVMKKKKTKTDYVQFLILNYYDTEPDQPTCTTCTSCPLADAGAVEGSCCVCLSSPGNHHCILPHVLPSSHQDSRGAQFIRTFRKLDYSMRKTQRTAHSWYQMHLDSWSLRPRLHFRVSCSGGSRLTFTSISPL